VQQQQQQSPVQQDVGVLSSPAQEQINDQSDQASAIYEEIQDDIVGFSGLNLNMIFRGFLFDLSSPHIPRKRPQYCLLRSPSSHNHNHPKYRSHSKTSRWAEEPHLRYQLEGPSRPFQPRQQLQQILRFQLATPPLYQPEKRHHYHKDQILKCKTFDLNNVLLGSMNFFVKGNCNFSRHLIFIGFHC
jgi:hypothetical protein